MATGNLTGFRSGVKYFNEDGTATPEFLRVSQSLIGTVNGTTGTSAGVDPAVGGVNLTNFTMDSATPSSRQWLYPSTNPNTWNSADGVNARASQMTFMGDFISTNYFTLNPGGHCIVALRCDLTALAAGQPRFHGIVLNDVHGAQEGAPNWPTTQIESRATGLDPGGTLRYLFPNSQGPASKPLTDGVQYRVCIRSTLTENNQRFVRYQLWRLNTAHSSAGEGAWDIEVDTGDMLDANIWLDMTKTGLAFASVFETVVAPGAWSIFWSNLSVTWAGVKDSVTDASSRVARYDAQVEGDLTFQGNGRKFYVYTDSSGVAFDNWTHVISSTTNSATSLVATPNGTATSSNFLATNKSSLSASFGATWHGMNGANAEISTLGIGGAANPPLNFNIGGATPFTVKATGIRMAGGSVDIGVASTLLTGANNVGGVNAQIIAASAQNFETYCTPGQIAAVAGGPVETVLRPLWCEVSVMLADLRSRMLS